MEGAWLVNEAFCFSGVLKSNSVIIAAGYDSYSRTKSSNNTSAEKGPLWDREIIHLPSPLYWLRFQGKTQTEFLCRACPASTGLTREQELRQVWVGGGVFPLEGDSSAWQGGPWGDVLGDGLRGDGAGSRSQRGAGLLRAAPGASALTRGLCIDSFIWCPVDHLSSICSTWRRMNLCF